MRKKGGKPPITREKISPDDVSPGLAYFCWPAGYKACPVRWAFWVRAVLFGIRDTPRYY